MRYRVLSPTGDYSFGQGPSQILVNSPETVAQAVGTRLALLAGEWFLDQTDGLPFYTQVAGTDTQGIYDNAIRTRILGTPGVTSIDQYASSLDPTTRALTVAASISTIYGPAAVQKAIPT